MFINYKLLSITWVGYTERKEPWQEEACPYISTLAHAKPWYDTSDLGMDHPYHPVIQVISPISHISLTVLPVVSSRAYDPLYARRGFPSYRREHP